MEEATHLAERLTSVLIAKIFQEMSLVSKLREDLELIYDELECIKGLLKDTGGPERANCSSTRIWLQKLEDFLNEALDELEDTSQPQSSNYISRYLSGRKIRVLKKKISNIPKSPKYFEFLKGRDATPSSMLLSENSLLNREKATALIVEATTVGMQRDIDEITRLLVSTESSHQIIAVTGMGGLGKTLLLQHVFNSQGIKGFFKISIWVAVSQNFMEIQILEHIAQQIELHDGGGRQPTVEQLRDGIYSHLLGTERPCLLVLDDVWDRHSLEKIMKCFPLRGNNKVMLSTRNQKVAESMGAHSIHQMELLSPEDSWMLFSIHAFPDCHNNDPPVELKELARAIERKCSRLPLAVKTVAASMASVQRLPNVWESTLKALDDVGTIQEDVLPILKLSYDALPNYLKPCFLFCSAYPEDARMNCEYLVQVWVAQGFVNAKETQDPYELGFSYLNLLVDRCMIEFVPYDGKDYIIKYCKMHDLLHDLALSEAQKQRCLFQTGINLEKIPLENCQGQRRISLIKNKIAALDKPIHSPRLLTLLLWNNLPLKSICEQFFNRLKHLCVLDLSQTSIKSLPKSIAKLTHLRFLNLSRTYIKKLPRCLSGLLRLQLLDVSWCEELTSLHSGISNNQSLLHLNVTGCKNMVRFPVGTSKLFSLRILGEVVFDLRGNPKNSLKLTHLKGLTLLQQLSVAIGPAVELPNNIFGEMEDMRKFFFDNRDQNSRVELPEDMAVMKRLVILHLRNCVLPAWISHLNNLTLLLLERDHSENYEALQTIPNLRRLILMQNNKCIDFTPESETIDFAPESGNSVSFPNLEKLIIEEFSQLQKFPVLGDKAMPKLQYFRLVNCNQLKGLPQGLDLLNSLQVLQVIGCGETMVQEAPQFQHSSVSSYGDLTMF
ncbi:hypothetical protein SUGI_0251500 [Cryptomeria japonica]|nr:hypothetical protein SUGI_0251500 [Cryptomeria japonica]